MTTGRGQLSKEDTASWRDFIKGRKESIRRAVSTSSSVLLMEGKREMSDVSIPEQNEGPDPVRRMTR